MPADNILDPEATPADPAVTPPGNGADPAPPALDGAAVAQLISDSQAPLLEKIEQLANAASAAAAAATTTVGPVEPAAPTEDFLTRFANDPEGAIKGIVGNQMQSAVPLMSGLVNSTVSNFIGRERDDINREFGTGAWEKFFDKPMEVLLDSYRKTNVTALADDSTIRGEVDGLKGRQFNDLVEYRDASRKTTSEAGEADTKKLTDGVTEAVLAQTNLTGGIRRVGGGAEEITEGVKGYLDERIRALGGDETGKDFLARTDYGSSYEDYQAHQKKLEDAKGAS